MPYLNVKERVLETKIVYYGAGLSGKTTNLEQIKSRASQGRVGEMMSLNTDGDRTLFFDYLPFELGKVNGCDVKVQLFTVPGQAKYAETRKRVLAGADGVVVVLDSAAGALDRNRQTLADLRDHLQANGLTDQVPIVYQANKRDLPDAVDVETLMSSLGLQGQICIEAVAAKGQGVFETLKRIASEVLVSVRKAARTGAEAPIQAGEQSGLDGTTLKGELERDFTPTGELRAQPVSPAVTTTGSSTGLTRPARVSPMAEASRLSEVARMAEVAREAPIVPRPEVRAAEPAAAEPTMRAAVGASTPSTRPLQTTSRPVSVASPSLVVADARPAPSSTEPVDSGSMGPVLHDLLAAQKSTSRRLDTLLSSIRQEVASIVQESEREVTARLGRADDRFASMERQVDARTQSVDAAVQSLDERLQGLDARLAAAVAPMAELTELPARVGEMGNVLLQLTTHVEAVDATLAPLAELRELSERVGTVEHGVGQLGGQLRDLVARFGQLGSQVDGIAPQVASVDDAVRALEGRFAPLEGTLSELARVEHLLTLDRRVSELGDAHRALLERQTGNTNQLRQGVEALTGELSATTERLHALSERVAVREDLERLAEGTASASTEVRGHVDQAAERVDASLRAQSKMIAQLSQRLTLLETRQEELQEQDAARLATLEERLGETVAAIEAARADASTRHSELLSRIDRIIGRMEIADLGLARLRDEQGRAATELAGLQTQVEQLSKELAGDIRARSTSQGEQLRALTERVDRLTRANEEQSGRVLTQLEAHGALIAGVGTDIQDRLQHVVLDVRRHFEALGADQLEKIESAIYSVSKSVGHRFTELFDKMEQKKSWWGK